MILEANYNVCIKVKGNLCNGCNFETEGGECILFNCALDEKEEPLTIHNKRCTKCLNIFGTSKK